MYLVTIVNLENEIIDEIEIEADSLDEAFDYAYCNFAIEDCEEVYSVEEIGIKI